MAGDTITMNVDCEPDLDEDESRVPCDFTGWTDVTININLDGEWKCPRCDAEHTITNIDLHDLMGPDPDAAYERMRDARHG